MERYNITVKDNPFDGCPYADMVVSDDGAYMRYADAQRALDAERERVKELECYRALWKRRDDELTGVLAQLAALQAQLARWKEALGEWLWNCTNLLGDYHIKTVQDFNEEVNRRIAWLMQHLDHTLPPPMTDQERDRMRKLSEDNAALQADNECKDSLIESLQAQLRQAEGQSKQQAEEAVIVFAKYTTLRQLVEALPVLDMRFDSVAVGPLGWTVGGVTFGKVTEANAYSALLQYRATLAAKDTRKAVSSG